MKGWKCFFFVGFLIIVLVTGLHFAEAAENLIQGIVKVASEKPEEQKPIEDVEVQITGPNYSSLIKETEKDGRYKLRVPTEHRRLQATYRHNDYLPYTRREFTNNLAEKELDSVALNRVREDGKYTPSELTNMGKSVATILSTGNFNPFIQQSYSEIVTQMNRAGAKEKADTYRMAPEVFEDIRRMQLLGELCVHREHGECLFPKGFVN